MKYLIMLKKLIASVLSIDLSSELTGVNMYNLNYIIALNPLVKSANATGYIMLIMIMFIIILVGYTIVSNSKK